MRLINTFTLQMEDFMAKPPPYVILSHTWEDDEVSYQDLTTRREEARWKKGYAKIRETCRLAHEEGIHYAWVDTCCIDKGSSAELTEAINSMFAWYAAATFCVVHLSDLPADYTSTSSRANAPGARPWHTEFVAGLENCRWFTRGWTLQELIAPQTVRFYDSTWVMRGTKASLGASLTGITSIREDVLADPSIISTLSVAVKMGWASRRQTTRVEDVAYCLLGIFDVNMPLLYGEGDKAFLRLQEEIASRTADLTLFAWTAVTEDQPTESIQQYRGILAQSPAEFGSTRKIEPYRDVSFNEEFSVTNKGLKLWDTSLRVYSKDAYALDIHANYQGSTTSGLGILLKRQGPGLFVRAEPWRLAPLKGNIESPRTIFVRSIVTEQLAKFIPLEHRMAFQLGRGFHNHSIARLDAIEPSDMWDSQRELVLTSGLPDFVGCVRFVPRDPRFQVPGNTFAVVFGIPPSQRAWATLVTGDDGLALDAIWSMHLRELRRHSLRNRKTFFRTTEGAKHLVKLFFLPRTVDGQPVQLLELSITRTHPFRDKVRDKVRGLLGKG